MSAEEQARITEIGNKVNISTLQEIIDAAEKQAKGATTEEEKLRAFGKIAEEAARLDKTVVTEEVRPSRRAAGCIYRTTANVWQTAPDQCPEVGPCAAPELIRLLGLLDAVPMFTACQTSGAAVVPFRVRFS